MAHRRTGPRRDPLRLVVDLATGRISWSFTATVVAVAMGVVLLALVAGVIVV